MNRYNEEYQEIFDATCCLLKTFNGNSVKAVVEEVNEIMRSSAAMRQFMFDFYYNIKAVTTTASKA